MAQPIQDGRYVFAGIEYHVPPAGPDSHNPIHGFPRRRDWTCRRHHDTAVVIGIVLHPQMGYPSTLDVSVEYCLGQDGRTAGTTTPTSVISPARTAPASTPTSAIPT